MRTVNLSGKLALVAGVWRPKIVGQVNDFHGMLVKLVKLQGGFAWHVHEAAGSAERGEWRGVELL